METTTTEACGACHQEFATLALVFSHDCPAISGAVANVGVGHNLASVDAPAQGTGGTGGGRSGMRTNKFDARCAKCGGTVPAGEGSLDNEDGKWVVRHIGATCVAAAPAPQVSLPDSDDVAAWLLSTANKVEVAEVTPELVAAATQWAKGWTGTFEYMVDMKAAAIKGALTVGQAKGVLNCWRADLLRSQPKPATADGYQPVRGDVHVVDGRYYRVSEGQASGRLYANEWIVDGGFDMQHGFHRSGSWEYAQGAIAKLSEATIATAEQAAAFGHAYDKCVFCTHDLDIDRSIEVGYGPKCAAKRGLPW